MIIILLLGSQPLFAQIEFEPGYFITNTGDTVKCTIKNRSWESNPTKFDYRITEDSPANTLAIDSVQEFGFQSNIKYRRYVVTIDLSSYQKPNKDLPRVVDTLFFKVLLEGKASLFEYTKNEPFFFYTLDNGAPIQLIYKHTLRDDNRIVEKPYYKQQLKNELSCEKIDPGRAMKTRYTAATLISYFKDFNSCYDAGSITYNDNKLEKKKLFHFGIRAELQNSSLDIENVNFTQANERVSYGNKLNFAAGMDLELTLPFNRRKWRIFFEPSLIWYNNDKEVKVDELQRYRFTVDYQSIALAMGLRYHIFLKNSSSIFISSFFLAQRTLHSDLTIEYRVVSTGTSSKHELESNSIVGFGLGYAFKEHFAMECRYYTPREIMGWHTSYKSDFKTTSLALTYRF